MNLADLAKPFPPEEIEWRAQSVRGDKALALAYIDSRCVQERLDDVCGPENWQCEYEELQGGKKTICRIGIKVGEEWVWKADGAGDSDIEAEKGALSDAFKRAAVKRGIGRYLYDMPALWTPYEAQGKGGRFTVDPMTLVKQDEANAVREFKSDAIRKGYPPDMTASEVGKLIRETVGRDGRPSARQIRASIQRLPAYKPRPEAEPPADALIDVPSTPPPNAVAAGR